MPGVLLLVFMFYGMLFFMILSSGRVYAGFRFSGASKWCWVRLLPFPSVPLRFRICNSFDPKNSKDPKGPERAEDAEVSQETSVNRPQVLIHLNESARSMERTLMGRIPDKELAARNGCGWDNMCQKDYLKKETTNQDKHLSLIRKTGANTQERSILTACRACSSGGISGNAQASYRS